MLRRTALAFAVAAAVIAGTGCTARPAGPVSAPIADNGATQASDAAIGEISLMTADAKRSKIATSFPLEVPLPAGTVTRGEAQGTTAWDYEIVVGAPSAAVAGWYKQYYTARSWDVASEEPLSGGGVSLTLLKNGAQSRVTIEPQSAEKTKASGVLGIGTQVLRTQ